MYSQGFFARGVQNIFDLAECVLHSNDHPKRPVQLVPSYMRHIMYRRCLNRKSACQHTCLYFTAMCCEKTSAMFWKSKVRRHSAVCIFLPLCEVISSRLQTDFSLQSMRYQLEICGSPPLTWPLKVLWFKIVHILFTIVKAIAFSDRCTFAQTGKTSDSWENIPGMFGNQLKNPLNTRPLANRSRNLHRRQKVRRNIKFWLWSIFDHVYIASINPNATRMSRMWLYWIAFILKNFKLISIRPLLARHWPVHQEWAMVSFQAISESCFPLRAFNFWNHFALLASRD